MQTCLNVGMRYPGGMPSHADLYLSWFLNPLDVEWFRQKHGLILREMAEFAALHQLLYLYQ